MKHYSRILIGESYRISGFKLKPLQLGHVPLLEAIDCDPVTTAPQLAQAIFVCQLDWDTAKDRLFGGWFTARKIERIRRRVIKHGLISRFHVWNEYLTRNTELPHIQTTHDSKSGFESATPYIQHVRSTLISRCNYDPQSVMRAPYLQAMWDYLSLWETEGSCELVDRDWLSDMKEFQSKHSEAVIKAYNNRTGGTE